MSGPSRILAIETASEACSIALFKGGFEDGALLAHDHAVLGRGHAERLVPMIAQLPESGRAGRICVSRGPGSFTGVRIGIAAARALGLAWGAEVLGYPTLALVAAMARREHPGEPVTVCMTGGHGEWFLADFDADGLPQGAFASLTPDAAREWPAHPLVAGSKAREFVAARKGDTSRALDLLPDARALPALPPELLTHDVGAIYGRPPDATPQSPANPDTGTPR
ncbi:tRNA threonylcarbamoyl adenosine modification protein YeaZ [Erythrobacter litoralis]|jgi:tRNA threonylcarbamoyl adenosine modification protein YeaZ|uniref:Peptidase M22 n=1 Tax=Erythrobacter litoralis TaxID=39960 RepID=A0A074MDW3_9SPHN|nr:tRNA (adenosine(37)-N6)-threonylcarbamoyltransferase complex dimerization subunit type 1 TsaB [Erythrobacter litoralis]AOL23109.1 tRNA threonylcarbamoyl adenosine modification protein YeaZ [Erythrobacter litoralis]KEO93026.1 peptidase M22 [Erythrobacter litoralis]MEE4339343.1 tRNA (adenosine(37)-N6)-threonylcarbamoyltransferase complex dimerization subunit type 1 TsaB [Erythrobacter sp.]